MLGHEDIATTAKYAHAMIDDVLAAMDLTAILPVAYSYLPSAL
jgi:hypothetical protein